MWYGWQEVNAELGCSNESVDSLMRTTATGNNVLLLWWGNFFNVILNSGNLILKGNVTKQYPKEDGQRYKSGQGKI